MVQLNFLISSSLFSSLECQLVSLSPQEMEAKFSSILSYIYYVFFKRQFKVLARAFHLPNEVRIVLENKITKREKKDRLTVPEFNKFAVICPII